MDYGGTQTSAGWQHRWIGRTDAATGLRVNTREQQTAALVFHSMSVRAGSTRDARRAGT
jgi:hypothetical protein